MWTCVLCVCGVYVACVVCKCVCGVYTRYECVCVTHLLRMPGFCSEVTPEHPEDPAIRMTTQASFVHVVTFPKTSGNAQPYWTRASDEHGPKHHGSEASASLPTKTLCLDLIFILSDPIRVFLPGTHTIQNPSSLSHSLQCPHATG